MMETLNTGCDSYLTLHIMTNILKQLHTGEGFHTTIFNLVCWDLKNLSLMKYFIMSIILASRLCYK